MSNINLTLFCQAGEANYSEHVEVELAKGTCFKIPVSMIPEKVFETKQTDPLAEGVPVCMRCTLSYSSYY